MNLSSDNPIPTLMHLVRKVLEKIALDLPRFQALECDSKKELDSLINLLGQRHSVLTVGGTCLGWTSEGFACLQDKLLVKISSEVDSKVDVLKDIIQPLKDHHDHLSRSRTEILRILQYKGKSLDPVAIAEGTPTIPPLQVMLHWIDELELQLRELYYSRLHYLESILEPEVVSPESLAGLWMQSSNLLTTMQDVEEQTRFFLEDSR
ncbi:hypothetical protein EGW08_009586 [Elysia chlorotica]|uniref:Uncharacterized protein n=1 Tax=Elysia chlorotica TaxID=188477 RepID=A0A433TM20_ELYCH|nr:hypothetical protein EGW08_009586 [Elysia chlorotica]